MSAEITRESRTIALLRASPQDLARYCREEAPAIERLFVVWQNFTAGEPEDKAVLRAAQAGRIVFAKEAAAPEAWPDIAQLAEHAFARLDEARFHISPSQDSADLEGATTAFGQLLGGQKPRGRMIFILPACPGVLDFYAPRISAILNPLRISFEFIWQDAVCG